MARSIRRTPHKRTRFFGITIGKVQRGHHKLFLYVGTLSIILEGIRDWETARRYYADAHFAPTPHAEARTGLKRIYNQIEGRPTDTFEAFLKDTETEYRIREEIPIAKKSGRDLSRID